MTRPAPKCKTCGNHPRSKLHRDACGAPKPKIAQPSVRRGRKKVEEPAADVTVLPSGWIIGKTCISCNTAYLHTPFPEFQEPGAKHGQYDLYRQLPHCSPKYPICEKCLPWAWRAERKRYGMEQEFKRLYPEMAPRL